MRKQLLLSVVLLFILTAFSSSKNKEQRSCRQSNIQPAAEPNWIGLLETDTELEVLYSLTNCDNQKKMLLKYFNEVPNAQQIKFNVTLKYSGYVLETEKLKSVSANQLIAADCSVSDSTMFVLLPPQWELDRVTVTARLIEVNQ